MLFLIFVLFSSSFEIYAENPKNKVIKRVNKTHFAKHKTKSATIKSNSINKKISPKRAVIRKQKVKNVKKTMIPLKYKNIQKSFKNHHTTSSTNVVKYASIVVDAETDKILFAVNEHEPRYPASLTKMMTLYLLFEAMDKGKLKKTDLMTVSRAASKQPKSNLSLKHNDKISVENAIYGLAVKSANDVAYVVAEKIGGNVHSFVRMMNNKARKLGMHNTQFRNPHGWHDYNQVTTAYDMYILARALQNDFPHYYHMFSRQHFFFKGQRVDGHNDVMKKYPGATGLKTGYVRMSGFNLATTTKRSDGSLIAVVMGGSSKNARDNHMIDLLNQGYQKLAAQGIMKPPVQIYQNDEAEEYKNVFAYAESTNQIRLAN